MVVDQDEYQVFRTEEGLQAVAKGHDYSFLILSMSAAVFLKRRVPIASP
jgi:hypothetical protein